MDSLKGFENRIEKHRKMRFIEENILKETLEYKYYSPELKEMIIKYKEYLKKGKLLPPDDYDTNLIHLINFLDKTHIELARKILTFKAINED